MQAFLVILEFLGLTLALVDFLGYTPVLQGFVDRHRRKLFDWLYLERHKKIAGSTTFFVLSSIPAWILFAWFWYALLTHKPNAGLVALWYVGAALGPLLLLYVLIPLVYNVLLTFNRSITLPGGDTDSSKTVGKVSLFVALGSSILQRVWEHYHHCG